MNTPHEQPPAVETATVAPPLITVATVVYVLQAVGLFFPPAFVIAVIIDYVKRDDVRGTFLESHFRWQIRTFWFGLLWTAVGLLTWVILIGYAVHAAVWIWLAYRIIKGWLDLVDRKPMYRNSPA